MLQNYFYNRVTPDHLESRNKYFISKVCQVKNFYRQTTNRKRGFTLGLDMLQAVDTVPGH